MKRNIRIAVALVLLLALTLSAASAFAAVNSFTPANELNFKYMPFLGGQTFKVYSGPGRYYWRGANGWAKVYSDEAIYCAGDEGDWLLVQYYTSSGMRVGYVTKEDVSERVNATDLHFDYTTKRITRQCNFTDDPSSLNNPIGYLRAGDTVTYLSKFYNGFNWAYVETSIEGAPIRGFVPMDCIQ